MFPEKAIKLAASLEGSNSLIVVGGGEFANLIRKYDGDVGFSEDVTHETAIDCMDILAKLLNDKLAFTEISHSLEDAMEVSDSGKIPVLICSEILREEDPFAHSWNVTSDSISAYVAGLLGARLLIATDVDGIYDKDPDLPGAKLINEIDVNELLSFKESSIDLMLPSLLIKFGLDCFVVNGEHVERVLSLIGGDARKAFPYTFISCG